MTITGTTKSGFSYAVPDTLGDDFRVLEALEQSQSGDVLAYVRLTRLVLGEEGMTALKAHLAREGGFVSTEALVREMTEIFTAVSQKDKSVKNS